VKNDGDIPVRLVADARLLVLEVTPRSAIGRRLSSDALRVGDEVVSK